MYDLWKTGANTCAQSSCLETFHQLWLIQVCLKLGTRLKSFGNQFEVPLLERLVVNWLVCLYNCFPVAP